MGILLLFVGAAIGVFIGVIGYKFALTEKKRKTNPIFTYHPKTRQLSLTWQKIQGKHPKIRVGTKDTVLPELDPHTRFVFEERPSFMIDTVTGEPFNPFPTQAMPHVWPNARHRMEAMKDIREKKVSDSIEGNDWNMAKIGVLLGGISVFLLVLLLVIVWNFVRQTGAF